MYMTRDYLKVDPWTAVIEMINNEYGTELQPYSTQLVSLESLGGKSTKIKIKTNISTSPTNTMPKVELPEYFIYDRIDLSTLFKGGPQYLVSNVRLPMTTFQVAGMVDKKNEVVFSYTDLEADQFDLFDRQYKFVARKDSLRFVGNVGFSFVNTLKQSIAGFNKVEFPQANTWQFGNDGSKTTGNYLFTGYDFTTYRDTLIPEIANKHICNPNALLNLIGKVTGQIWTVDGNPVDNNLCYEIYQGEPRIKVVYNGIRDAAYTSRTDMTYVLVLALSPTRCSNVSGYLLLHYN